MKKIINNITVNNVKYEYSLTKKKGGTVLFECKDAKISQEFLKEDVVDLIIDLPNLIIAEKEYKNKQSEVIRFRVSAKDKKRVEGKAIKDGYSSVSDYLRHLALG